MFTMVWNMVSESNVTNGQGGILSAKVNNTISYIEKMGNVWVELMIVTSMAPLMAAMVT